MLNRRLLAFTGLTAAIAAFAIAPVLSQGQDQRPVARYTMDAGTLSGMAAMTQGGGGGGMLAMLSGRGGQAAHELVLRLGSNRSPTGGEAEADHFMPEGMRLGRSVPLTHQRSTGNAGPAQQGEMPRGRLLLFWGCGEHAGAGQPVVIDFAQLARGEIPPGLYASGLNLPEDWSVRPDNSATYGDWPNSDDGRRVDGSASLLGHHRVAGNYSPEIAFDLNEDFMPALNPVGTELRSGAVAMRWNALERATGYYAWAIGAGANERDMVWWTSASSQQFGGPFADWISPSTARRYIEAGTLMPPTQSDCTIPAEVTSAAGQGFMTSLYAYGPQVDFSYPPRPENAAASWRPEWIARVRFRSMAMMIPGMDLGGMDVGGDQGAAATPAPPPGLPPCRGGLRGLAERAAGRCQ